LEREITDVGLKPETDCTVKIPTLFSPNARKEGWGTRIITGLRRANPAGNTPRSEFAQAGQPPGWSCCNNAERSGWFGLERIKTICPFMDATNLSAERSRKNRRSM